MAEQDIQIIDVRSLNDDAIFDGAYETVNVTDYDSDNLSAPLELNKSNPKCQDYTKPTLSFTVLASLAFKNAEYGRLTVEQIYSFIKRQFPHTLTADKNWKNSVQNTLCMSPYFMRLIPCKTTPLLSGTVPTSLQDEKGLTWAVNPSMLVELEDLIMRSAALAERSASCSKHKSSEWIAGDDAAEEPVVPQKQVRQPKPVVFTQYKDGLLPLVTLYAETPGDYEGCAANYPVQF